MYIYHIVDFDGGSIDGLASFRNLTGEILTDSHFLFFCNKSHNYINVKNKYNAVLLVIPYVY